MSEIQTVTRQWAFELSQANQNANSSISNYSNFELIRPITTEEVRRSITAAKTGRAVGIDNLPNEVLKSGTRIPVLETLFIEMFATWSSAYYVV